MDASKPRRLEGRRILLGVTGGIAAYKALDLVGRLRDDGCDVRVVMTRAATNFVTPLSFQARSANPVYTDMWELAQSAAIEHIEYARWADLLVVAPATAHTLAKFALGLADDPLSTLYLAYDGPTVVAPAMNAVMWRHPATVAHARTLAERGVVFVAPVEGALACGEIGVGKMAPVETVVEAAVAALARTRAGAVPAPLSDLKGCRVLVTAGPTREHLDPTRFLSNPSTGKMGYALAVEAARRGARVVLVSGPTACSPPEGVRIVPVVSASEMSKAALAEYDGADLVIFCAAVADYAPAKPAPRKIKKTSRPLKIELVPTPDIAFETASRARPGQLRVGFAAETDDLEANAARKLEDKKLDFIVANDVSSPEIGFASDDNRAILITADGRRERLERMSKTRMAALLLDRFAQALHNRKKASGSKPRP
jgi:phosphopantothenoylcysteine decarboxylase/phosphopantothenate--cysteine ligase